MKTRDVLPWNTQCPILRKSQALPPSHTTCAGLRASPAQLQKSSSCSEQHIHTSPYGQGCQEGCHTAAALCKLVHKHRGNLSMHLWTLNSNSTLPVPPAYAPLKGAGSGFGWNLQEPFGKEDKSRQSWGHPHLVQVLREELGHQPSRVLADLRRLHHHGVACRAHTAWPLSPHSLSPSPQPLFFLLGPHLLR